MKLLTTWNPIQDLDVMQNRLSEAFFRTPVTNGYSEDSPWEPVVDAIENDKEYHLALELPGIKREDIDVQMNGDWLQISGERKYPEEDTKRKFRRVERFYGHFSRRFKIPEDADRIKISAEYRDGLLQVSIAKTAEAQPKLIDIKVK